MIGLGLVLLNPAAWAEIDQETGRWVPGIGDPTLFGWLTVLAYLAAGLLAFRNALAAWRYFRFDAFWWALGGLCCLLAVNKQLDLQTWFTQWGRDMAIAQGWYEQRRVMQKGLILMLAVSGIAVSVLMWLQAGRRWRDYRIAAIGAALLLCFIVARAATFHHVDQFLALQFGSMKANFLFEIGAISLIAMGALRWRRAVVRR